MSYYGEIKSGQKNKQQAPILAPKVQLAIDERRKMTYEQRQADIIRRRDIDSEEVVGVFKNLECPRGSVEFGIKLYPGEEITYYHLMDGERYRLPRGVAKHLNQNCYYKEYKHMNGDLGQMGIRQGTHDGGLNSPTMQAGVPIHRFAFHSLEFMDEELMFEMKPANIIEVTYT